MSSLFPMPSDLWRSFSPGLLEWVGLGKCVSATLLESRRVRVWDPVRGADEGLGQQHGTLGLRAKLCCWRPGVRRQSRPAQRGWQTSLVLPFICAASEPLCLQQMVKVSQHNRNEIPRVIPHTWNQCEQNISAPRILASCLWNLLFNRNDS